MDFKLFKKVPLAIAAVAISASAFAGMDMDSRVTALETQMKQARAQNVLGSAGARTAVARPDADLTGFFAGIGFVYQQAKAGGTEYAISENDRNGAYPVNGNMQDIDYKWGWGLNLMAGYNMPNDGMDLRVNYNYFDQSSAGTFNSGANDSVVPLRSSSSIVDGNANGFVLCRNANSDYSLNMNLLDLQFGRDLFLSQKLNMRPFVGLGTEWIKQVQTTQYRNGDGSGILGNNNVNVSDTSKFWGIGPEFGVNSKWFLGRGFSLFGDLKGSVFYGRFNVLHTEVLSNNQTTQSVNINGDVHRLVPATQMALGVAYDTYLDKNTHHFSIRLGWNLQYYFFMNQMLKPSYETGAVNRYAYANENLGIQGLTLDVVWSF